MAALGRHQTAPPRPVRPPPDFSHFPSKIARPTVRPAGPRPSPPILSTVAPMARSRSSQPGMPSSSSTGSTTELARSNSDESTYGFPNSGRGSTRGEEKIWARRESDDLRAEAEGPADVGKAVRRRKSEVLSVLPVRSSSIPLAPAPTRPAATPLPQPSTRPRNNGLVVLERLETGQAYGYGPTATSPSGAIEPRLASSFDPSTGRQTAEPREDVEDDDGWRMLPRPPIVAWDSVPTPSSSVIANGLAVPEELKLLGIGTDEAGQKDDVVVVVKRCEGEYFGIVEQQQQPASPTRPSINSRPLSSPSASPRHSRDLHKKSTPPSTRRRHRSVFFPSAPPPPSAPVVAALPSSPESPVPARASSRRPSRAPESAGPHPHNKLRKRSASMGSLFETRSQYENTRLAVTLATEYDALAPTGSSSQGDALAWEEYVAQRTGELVGQRDDGGHQRNPTVSESESWVDASVQARGGSVGSVSRAGAHHEERRRAKERRRAMARSTPAMSMPMTGGSSSGTERETESSTTTRTSKRSFWSLFRDSSSTPVSEDEAKPSPPTSRPSRSSVGSPAQMARRLTKAVPKARPPPATIRTDGAFPPTSSDREEEQGRRPRWRSRTEPVVTSTDTRAPDRLRRATTQLFSEPVPIPQLPTFEPLERLPSTFEAAAERSFWLQTTRPGHKSSPPRHRRSMSADSAMEGPGLVKVSGRRVQPVPGAAGVQTEMLTAMLDIEQDDVFLQALETIRRKESLTRRHQRPSSPTTSRTGHRRTVPDWRREVQALFGVRELIASERSYRQHLQHLLESVSGSTVARASTIAISPRIRRNSTRLSLIALGPDATPASPPTPAVNVPSLLKEHLPALIAVADHLLERLADDPSPWGTATAFLALEEEMSRVLGAWSVVVNDILSSLTKRDRRRSLRGPKSDDGHLGTASVFNVNPFRGPAPPVSASATQRSRLSSGDIVIMPTQRVTRYQLFLKELVKSTAPGCPAHILVEHALESARNVAEACNLCLPPALPPPVPTSFVASSQ